MRILILGGSGMLGHQLFKQLSNCHDVKVTVRQDFSYYSKFGIFSENNTYSGIDVLNFRCLVEVLADFYPEVIVNAVGVIKQRNSSKQHIPNIEINALFPHRLATLCNACNIRLIHLSTDCVFSGKKGCYNELNQSDAEDIYGKTKFLGEVHDKNCLTLRTSMIGKELLYKNSLLEWFLAKSDTVKGFKHAIFSGFTTLELSRIIEKIMIAHPDKYGLYHVSSKPISKFDLLMLIKKKMNLTTEIIPDTEFCCDRSLDSSKFYREFKYRPPSWEEMINELIDQS